MTVLYFRACLWYRFSGNDFRRRFMVRVSVALGRRRRLTHCLDKHIFSKHFLQKLFMYILHFISIQ